MPICNTGDSDAGAHSHTRTGPGLFVFNVKICVWLWRVYYHTKLEAGRWPFPEEYHWQEILSCWESLSKLCLPITNMTLILGHFLKQLKMDLFQSYFWCSFGWRYNVYLCTYADEIETGKGPQQGEAMHELVSFSPKAYNHRWCRFDG